MVKTADSPIFTIKTRGGVRMVSSLPEVISVGNGWNGDVYYPTFGDQVGSRLESPGTEFLVLIFGPQSKHCCLVG